MSVLLKRAFLIFLALLVMPLAVHARPHALHHQQDADSAATGTQLGAGAAFDHNGRLWVATVRGGHVRVRHSDDKGHTLSTPVVVNAVAEKIDASLENHPSVAIGDAGQVYVSWVHRLPKKWASEVRFARSLDHGKTFSRPITVNDTGSAGLSHSFATMAVDGHGHIVLAWLDSRDMAASMAAGGTHRGLAVYYSWSRNGGAAFGPDQRLMDHSCECCRIALARRPDGRVVSMFRGLFDNNIRDHALGVLRSEDGSSSWQRVTFSQWQVAACPEQGPGLAVDAHGTRHAVWYEASDGPTIWYGQLDPGHPARNRHALAGAGAGHADVAVHGHNVYVVWNQVGAKGYTLTLRRSDDGGASFGEPRALASSNQAAYSPQLLQHDGSTYVAWNTASGFRLVPVE